MKKILLGFIAIGLITFVGCGTSKKNISTTIDLDGNTYKTVKIGTQEWMEENLNLDHFQNGDIIQEAKTKEEWFKAGENRQPACCNYDNNSSNGEKYGKLYNFYAVSDPRGLALNGWHVPTDAEWTVLENYLGANGYSDKTGDALKSKYDWKDIRDGTSRNGTDDYGWLGLPGGYLNSLGVFDYIGNYGYWWSSSQYSTDNAWYRDLSRYDDYVYRNDYNKSYGFSVRCLRD